MASSKRGASDAAAVAAAATAPESDADNIPYGDMHKIVLQGIMGAGCLDAKGVKALFESACDYLRITGEERTRRTKMDFMKKIFESINQEISPFGMSVKSGICELSAQKYLMYVVTHETSILRHQVAFSQDEVTVFVHLLDRIMRMYPNFALPTNDCINIWTELKPKVGLLKGEQFLNRIIDLQYFTRYITSTTTDITIGVKCIKEMEELLMEHYGDIMENCGLCRAIMLQGYRCPKCKVLVHKGCYLKSIRKRKECLECGVDWSREKDMLRRNRDTDEVIKAYGPNVNLSAYKPSRQISKDYESRPMPRLEPQVFLEPVAGPSRRK